MPKDVFGFGGQYKSKKTKDMLATAFGVEKGNPAFRKRGGLSTKAKEVPLNVVLGKSKKR